jgi:TP901 family phage tail tape measure protein
LLAGGIRAIGSAATGAAGALFGMAMSSADLNAQISGIAALAGGGAEEMAALKEEINALAMNPQLVVSTTEAADVMQNLIANGLTVTDVLNGAAEATVLLGNAAGADLATSATVMSDTMTIFGIEAENAMTAVDGISRVTNQSKFDVNDYALALAQGGAQAASAGVEFDDFNAMLVAAASNFSSGSDAGTGIRNMLTKLIPTTSDATTTMYELGLMTTDYTAASSELSDMLGYEVAPNVTAVSGAFAKMMRGKGVTDIKKLNTAWEGFTEDFQDSAFFDVNGQLEDAATIAGALNTAFEGLSEQEVSESLNTMFGPDAARAVLAMAEYTEEGFRAMQAEMNGTASAMENAAIRTDNLKGDMDAFAGTVEATSNVIGDAFEPALRTIYQSGNTLLNNMQPYIKSAADGIANYLNTVTPKIESWATNMATTMSNAFNLAQGGAGGIAAAIGSVTGANVTFDADAEITNVDWGNFSYTYDATSDIHTVNWGTDTFTYDASAGITTVEWGEGNTFEYSATSGITSIDWKEADFTYTYDAKSQITEVDWSDGAFTHTYNARAQVGETSVLWGAWTTDYYAKARVTSVLWGVFYNHYEATAGVKSVAWGLYEHVYEGNVNISSVLWGLYKHTYTSTSSVASVLWGLYSHSYDATAAIGEEGLFWGAYTHTYDADGSITSVLWGTYTNKYNATTGITTVDWGLFTYDYDTTGSILSITWGAFTTDYDVTASVTSVIWGAWDHVYSVGAKITEWFTGSPPPTQNAGSIAPSGSRTTTGTGGGYVPSGATGGGRSLGLMPAMAGAGGGNVTININGYNQDEESLARRIAAIIQRRG